MEVIGHRGAAGLAPENTWEGFDVALSLGVDAIETDVRETADGTLVLRHDAELERTTNGCGFLKETTWEVVQTLDAGSWFSDAYRGAKVPRLCETLEHYGRRTHLVLELKERGLESRVLGMVQQQGLLQSVTFTSFDFDIVVKIKAAEPSARTGYLTREVTPEAVVRTKSAGLNQFCPPASSVSAGRVAEWKALGLEVRVWQIRSPELMHAAITAGVDGMTVDFPDVLLKALGRQR